MSEDNAITAALELFDRAGVEYVLVGGAAVVLHGSAYVTMDVDFCCKRVVENMERISQALNAVHPRFRVEGIPEGVPTTIDVRTLRAGEAFSFITDIGYLDVRFTVDGIGDYAAVLALSESVDFGERTICMLSVEGLIQSKSFMRRPRDLQVLPELELMREAAARAPDVQLEREEEQQDLAVDDELEL